MEHKSQNAAVKQNGAKQQSNPASLTPGQVAAAMERTVQRVRQMSHQERVQSLKDAGILTRSGRLASSYR
jgi:hypothetical protein